MKKILKLVYDRGVQGLDVIRHPALIPFYVVFSFIGTTTYIYLGGQTPAWFCFFFSCIMFLHVIFCLYLYKCITSQVLRTFISFATTNGLIIWAYYIMCFLHDPKTGWASKHSLEIPIFQALTGILLYIHYIFIGRKQTPTTAE